MIAVGDAAWITIAGSVVGLGLIVAVVVIVFRRPGGDIKAELGALKVTLGAVHDAVNDRPKDSPTLSQQVATMAEHIEQIDAKVTTVATELAAHVLANPGLPEAKQPKGPPRPRYGA